MPMERFEAHHAGEHETDLVNGDGSHSLDFAS